MVNGLIPIFGNAIQQKRQIQKLRLGKLHELF
jgi:hypothetical protein